MGCVITFEAEETLAAAAVSLGAAQVAGWSDAEQRLAALAGPDWTRKGPDRACKGLAGQIRDQILAGGDPLGEAFCRLRDPARRRPADHRR